MDRESGMYREPEQWDLGPLVDALPRELDAAVRRRLFTELGIGIRSVTVTRPSLDDVFLTSTGRTIRDSEGPPQRMAPFPRR